MTALGQQQSFSIISGERLVSGVKRPLRAVEIGISERLLSARSSRSRTFRSAGQPSLLCLGACQYQVEPIQWKTARFVGLRFRYQ